MFGPLDRTQTHMSDLIRRRRAVTTTQSSEPLAQLTSAVTAPALMDHLAVGPTGSQVPTSLALSVAQPVRAMRRHQPASTTDTTSIDVSSQEEHLREVSAVEDGEGQQGDNSGINIGYGERHRAALMAELHSSLAHDIGHVMPDETKTEVRGQLSTNYNLEDLDDESLAYVNRLFSERYKQRKRDLHHYFEACDDPQVALQEGCRRSLRGGRIVGALHSFSGTRFCGNLIKPKSIRAIGRRRLFSITQVPGPSPIGWMHGGRGGGSKFPEIDVFGDVYVRPGNELGESLHINDDGGEEPVGSSGVHLPTSSRYSDRVCGSSTGCYVSNLDGDIVSNSREEIGDILSRDGECQAEGTQTLFISAIKQSGDSFDSIGGHSSKSDVGHSAVPRAVRHSSPAF
ncbi:hypothetical protein Prudu_012766 [Prunus dulcis]|uniref:Uncharacterized protein n=1 Tax=Prunus dulcis TaxID=3755 RepID=A0A4Y1RDK4_PRUDU|nr:hypothetical protein Prudu_012766 [Prunus dulcis]